MPRLYPRLFIRLSILCKKSWRKCSDFIQDLLSDLAYTVKSLGENAQKCWDFLQVLDKIWAFFQRLLIEKI